MANEYDFIVVGGGASGCVVASRLAEASTKPSVVLIEAGGLNEDAAPVTGASRFELAFQKDSPLNWGYKTQPQCHGRELDYSRGKGLGGSTAINFCGWAVGPDEDYDEWARMVADDTFGWDHAKQCIRRIENFHNDVPAGFQQYIKPKDQEHGTGGGAVDLSYQEDWLPTTHDVFAAAQEVGYKINEDVNNGSPIGIGIGPVSLYKGVRVSSSSAYLANPPANLTVVAHAQVAKVIIEGQTAIGVQTTDGRQFNARKEIILSGGAINTPQILLLSGIGPSDELSKHGITTAHNMPQVGKNLRDHCFSTAGIVIKKTHDKTFKQSPTPMGWFQIPAVLGSEEFEALPVATQNYLRKPNIPNWEMATHTPFFDGTPVETDEEIFSAICIAMNPQSRGTVTLKSSDPAAAPIIDPKLLTHPFDRRTAIESMRELLRYLQAPVWKQKTVRNLGRPRDDSEKQYGYEYFLSNLYSSWHMCGTVRMGQDAEDACVDASFKVMGLKQLRVADMSVCPFILNNHPQSTAYVVGELAAEKLVAEHGLDRAEAEASV
ncbi:glucose-methanol-choline oxidoreductase-like protein [Pseudomassariella vexata]|uniref:Glucose-methanol-choline oxidoreductase-like protein n=1 Tax=Pseudomassariella vexata TaxID=1141098 RepID=A0A1Y2E3E4_9PEZI|nr:glucose-methanol-choline oxidoreductase-like protein [Pseudomassariella vexata]ORY66063.1 glucose-methanol-choline oxidoreductase-like protein [Pseudomassariella vexata]